MPQPAYKRLVTEEKLNNALTSEVPEIIAKQKTRLLGSQYDTVLPGSVPSSKAVVSLTSGDVTDGLVVSGSQAFLPASMYNVAECNWNAQTLSPYGSAFVNKTKSGPTGTCFDFTTMFEGKYAMFLSYKAPGIIQDLRVWIDDVEVTDWYLGTRASGTLQTNKPEIPCTTNNVHHCLNINFAKRGFYKIRVAGTAVSGVTSLMGCNAEGKFHKPKKQRVFGVISDSCYDTISSTNSSQDVGVEIAAQTGWKQWNMANGGSGFINPSVLAGGPHNFASDAVFTALEKAPPLDLLILNGSLNDMAYTDTQVTDAMQTFFDRWRTVRPETPIVWQGLGAVYYFRNIHTLPAIVAREEVQRAKAMSDPSVIGTVLPAKENWITGTGNVSSPNGTGNQDFIIGPDDVHLSMFGCRWMGRLVSERMASMSTWRGV